MFFNRKEKKKSKAKIFILNLTICVMEASVAKTMTKLEMRSKKRSIATQAQIWLLWEHFKSGELKKNFIYFFFFDGKVFDHPLQKTDLLGT